MNTNLEDHLRRLTDPVAAPPTDRAREAITRRKGVLHRRRQTRNAALGSAFVVLVVAGSLFLRSTAETVDTVPASGPDAETVAVSFDGRDGWEPKQTWENIDQHSVADSSGSAYQVFLRDGDPGGPTVLLFHEGVSDTEAYDDGYVDVPIGEATGHLATISPTNYRLDWIPAGGAEARATIIARHLTREEVLAFARGLVAKDRDLVGGAPGSPDDVFGFDAGTRPEGITEVDLTQEMLRSTVRRQVLAVAPGGFMDIPIDITTVTDGPYTYTSLQESGAVDARIDIRKIRIAGHTGRLFHTNDETGFWRLEVALAKDVRLEISVMSPVDRADLTKLISHLEFLDAPEWERLKDRYPGG